MILVPITKEQLTRIDCLLAAEGIRVNKMSPPWYTSLVLQKVPQDLEEHGVVGTSVEPLLRARSKYEKSLWLVIRDPEDGQKFRLVPELHLRAMLLFGDIPLGKTPVTTDGGVILVEKIASKGMVKSSRFGIPAGTVEYRKRWREENKDKVREASKRYQAKQREEFKRLKGLGEVKSVAELFGLTQEDLDKVSQGEEQQEGQTVLLPLENVEKNS